MQLEKAQWLATHGHGLLASPEDLERFRSRGGPSWQLALLDDQLEFRKRMRRRFPDATKWLWTDRSLSQASDWWTAQFKASLFPAEVAVMDACCGAGVDLVAIALRGPAVGVDADEETSILALANARAHGVSAEVRVGSFPQAFDPGLRWLHIDPDRRSAGTRTNVADQFSPPIGDVLRVAQQQLGAIVKIAPSTVLEAACENELEQFAERCWVGSFGQCRQQLLLLGALRSSTLGRRAVLCQPQDGAMTCDVPRQTLIEFRGAVTRGSSPLSRPKRFVYDLHAVLHASQLQTRWASENSLEPLEATTGFYTGEAILNSPWAQCFEVIEVLPWDDRKVRRWLHKAQAGEVEVKNRVHRLDANYFQRRYSVAGRGEKVTLLVTKLAGRVRAIACRRLGFSERDSSNGILA